MEKVTQVHQEYMSLVNTLNQEQLCRPNTCGDWSVKDIIAHITWYEREMVGLLSGRALQGSPLWEIPTDNRNEIIHERVKEYPISMVFAESDEVFKTLLTLLDGLKDEELNEAKYFLEMPAEWTPREVIASNTYEHYSNHVGDIRRSFNLGLNQESKHR